MYAINCIQKIKGMEAGTNIKREREKSQQNLHPTSPIHTWIEIGTFKQ